MSETDAVKGLPAGPDAVRAQLHRLIQSGQTLPDGRLPTERDLSRSLGVGRRAVRLALDQLEAEGLVWRRQGKGTFAGQPPDPTQALAAQLAGETNFMEVMEARLCIEPRLAAMAAERASPAVIAAMENLADRILSAPDPDSFELWDGALHRLISRTAGNRPLLTAFSMIDEIRGNEAWRGLRSRARSARTLRASDRDHRLIIAAIARGDAPGAEAAMRAHLETLAQNLRRILTEERVQP